MGGKGREGNGKQGKKKKGIRNKVRNLNPHRRRPEEGRQLVEVAADRRGVGERIVK